MGARRLRTAQSAPRRGTRRSFRAAGRAAAGPRGSSAPTRRRSSLICVRRAHASPGGVAAPGFQILPQAARRARAPRRRAPRAGRAAARAWPAAARSRCRRWNVSTSASSGICWPGSAAPTSQLGRPDGDRRASSIDGRATIVLREPPADPLRERTRLRAPHGTFDLPDFELEVVTAMTLRELDDQTERTRALRALLAKPFLDARTIRATRSSAATSASWRRRSSRPTATSSRSAARPPVPPGRPRRRGCNRPIRVPPAPSQGGERPPDEWPSLSDRGCVLLLLTLVALERSGTQTAIAELARDVERAGADVDPPVGVDFRRPARAPRVRRRARPALRLGRDRSHVRLAG